MNNELKACYFLNYSSSSKKLPERHTLNSYKKFKDFIRKNDYFFCIAQGEYFISTYLPTSDENDLFTSNNSTIISAKDKARAKGLDENSNPVPVLFKLKHF